MIADLDDEADQIQKLTSGYEKRGNTAVNPGPTPRLLFPLNPLTATFDPKLPTLLNPAPLLPSVTPFPSSLVNSANARFASSESGFLITFSRIRESAITLVGPQ